MGMRRHPRGDPAFVGVTPTQAGVAYQPAAILNSLAYERIDLRERAMLTGVLLGCFLLTLLACFTFSCCID